MKILIEFECDETIDSSVFADDLNLAMDNWSTPALDSCNSSKVLEIHKKPAFLVYDTTNKSYVSSNNKNIWLTRQGAFATAASPGLSSRKTDLRFMEIHRFYLVLEQREKLIKEAIIRDV